MDGELWLRLVGGFAVHQGGRLQHANQIGSRKARMLLALLAVQRWRPVGVDRIAEVLWGDAPPHQPARSVATLVSRLRATLGAEAILGDCTGYQLGTAVRVDLYDACALIGAAESRLRTGEPSLAFEDAKRALTLLDDAVLIDHPAANWAEPAQVLHTGLLRRARHAVADAALRAGDAKLAAAAAEAAVHADPIDEAAYRTLMRAYDAASEPARALTAYERLRAALAHELGVDPARPTRDLHTAILRRNAAGTTAARAQVREHASCVRCNEAATAS